MTLSADAADALSRRPDMAARAPQALSGYKLANDGQDTRAVQHYLGHRSIISTARYTALAPDRFRNLKRKYPQRQ